MCVWAGWLAGWQVLGTEEGAAVEESTRANPGHKDHWADSDFRLRLTTEQSYRAGD